MDNRVLLLSALLHDIGKVVRRSGESTSNHIYAGVEFITQNDFGLPDKDTILEVIKYHHAKELSKANLDKTHIAYIVYEADNIASAIDRRKYLDNNFGHEMNSLDSVFNVLNADLGNKNLKSKFIVNMEEEIDIPCENEGNITQGQYSEIIRRIKEQFNNIDFNIESEDTILNIIENLLKNVPSSSYVDVPDISLYDHLKLTGAISTCMYKYFNELGINDYKDMCFDNAAKNRKEKQFLLVSGDFSGIQDFIYTITSKRAMKALRGRSLYLELLSEHIIDEILEKLSMSRANLIYSGGGHFYLLLPNTIETKNVLSSAKDTINKWLLEKYHIQLYLEIGWTECTADELGNDLSKDTKDENLIGGVYRRVSYEVSKGKVNRYSNEQMEMLFNPDSIVNKIDSYERECSICKKSSANLDENNICQECDNLIDLGQKSSAIGKSRKEYLMVIYDDVIVSKSLCLEFPKLDGGNYFMKILEKSQYLNNLGKHNEIIRAYSINNLVVGEHLVKNIWIGNYNIPSEKPNTLIEFDDLVKKSIGIERLAVLRADVDNLGATFIRGFENENAEGKYQYASMTRTAVLSRKLTEFFKQDINKIAGMKVKQFDYSSFISGDRINDKDGRDLSIVYSGGDDMFVIGTWNDILEFALDLKKMFDKYTQGKLTFSAGIGLFKNGFPIHQMAKITGRLEDVSKEHPNKNAITLFTENKNYFVDKDKKTLGKYCFSWDEFSDDVVEKKYKLLKKWFGEDEKNRINIGKSMLYKILSLVKNRLYLNNGSIDIARMAYLLGRLNQRIDKNNHMQISKYEELRIKLFGWLKNESDAQSLHIALQLFIYSLREKGE